MNAARMLGLVLMLGTAALVVGLVALAVRSLGAVAGGL